MTQDKLIDLCRYDIGWIEVVGGSDIDAYPESGFDVQCENEYPMLLSDLKTALSHFEDEKLSFEDFAFDWWCPITTYFYEDLCLDELLGPDPDNICDLPLPPLPETFTAAEYGRIMRFGGRALSYSLLALRRLGVVEQAGRKGRFNLYRLADSRPSQS